LIKDPKNISKQVQGWKWKLTFYIESASETMFTKPAFGYNLTILLLD